MGDLDRDAGAVAGVLLGAGGAAMLEVDQDGEGVADGRRATDGRRCPRRSRSRTRRARTQGRRAPGPAIRAFAFNSSAVLVDTGRRPRATAEAATGVPAPSRRSPVPSRKGECRLEEWPPVKVAKVANWERKGIRGLARRRAGVSPPRRFTIDFRRPRRDAPIRAPKGDATGCEPLRPHQGGSTLSPQNAPRPSGPTPVIAGRPRRAPVRPGSAAEKRRASRSPRGPLPLATIRRRRA